MDGIDFDGDGKIDVYFAHRQCEHVWGDTDNDSVRLECLKCGKIREEMIMTNRERLPKRIEKEWQKRQLNLNKKRDNIKK
jgi:hypothetical protein